MNRMAKKNEGSTLAVRDDELPKTSEWLENDWVSKQTLYASEDNAMSMSQLIMLHCSCTEISCHDSTCPCTIMWRIYTCTCATDNNANKTIEKMSTQT